MAMGRPGRKCRTAAGLCDVDVTSISTPMSAPSATAEGILVVSQGRVSGSAGSGSYSVSNGCTGYLGRVQGVKQSGAYSQT